MKNSLNVLLKIIFPIAIGFAVIYLLFGNEISDLSLSDVSYTHTTFIGLVSAFLLLFLRQFGLAWRFRALTDYNIGWRAGFKVTFLCDFTSSITPTSAGGSVLSMIFLHKEGIKLGRATAVTLTTLFLDELFFIVAAPILMIIAGKEQVFGFTDSATAADLMIAFWVVYFVLFIFTVLLGVGLFRTPHKIGRILIKLFSFPFLRRWKRSAEDISKNLIDTSYEIKEKSINWWLSPVVATLITWLARFLIVNALFYAFFPGEDQLTILARQFVVWGLLIFMPTPGGSGVSEVLFKTYYSDMVSGPLIAVMAIVWRVLTYYIYLLIGILILPTYIKLSRHKNEIIKS